ncbi:MAG: DnaJ domain-containing protein, partial [Acidobacteriota bacterium]
ELLDLRQGASLEEIRHAYHEKSARYHPDRYAHIDDPDLHEKLSFLLTRLNEAFATLSKRPEAQRYQQLVSKETQYEEQKKAWAPPAEVKTTKPSYRRKDRNEARRLFLRAKKAYAKRDYWKTIQLCRHAIELGENEPDHFHLLGLALAHNPKWRIDAEQNLKIASNLQPWQAKHFVALGELYEREGLHIRARKMFEHARAIDPSCPLPSSDS